MSASNPPSPTLWTIGHSTRTLDEFRALLSSAGIEAVADVRRFPGSRRYPHFEGQALQGALEARGIGYAHFPELGGRRKPRGDPAGSAWRNEAFRGYAEYMQSPEFRTGIERLTELARRRPTAVLCAEAVWWRCHRSLIADYLKVRGWRVLHILSPSKIEEHPYTSAARVVNGVLSYAPPGAQTELTFS